MKPLLLIPFTICAIRSMHDHSKEQKQLNTPAPEETTKQLQKSLYAQMIQCIKYPAKSPAEQKECDQLAEKVIRKLFLRMQD